MVPGQAVARRSARRGQSKTRLTVMIPSLSAVASFLRYRPAQPERNLAYRAWIRSFPCVVCGVAFLYCSLTSCDSMRDKRIPCAPDLGDAGLAYRAWLSHDSQGMAALVTSGRVVLLERRTIIRRERPNDTRIVVLSGPYIGYECWIPDQFFRSMRVKPQTTTQAGRSSK